MTSQASDLNFLLLIINTILGPIKQGLYHHENRPFNFIVPCIVTFSSSYVIYLIFCLGRMKNLDAISEILWILPLMIQYCCKAINGEVQRETAVSFVAWMRDLFEETTPTNEDTHFIERIALSCNRKCLTIANFIIR